jgi:riboflavin-specific deaminase-like protein
MITNLASLPSRSDLSGRLVRRVALFTLVLLAFTSADADARRRIRPQVTAVVGQTLDGRIASRSGDSMWITGRKFSMGRNHELRSSHDMIMVGIGTVLNDNPRLLHKDPTKSPMRVIVDSMLRTPLESQLLTKHPEKTTFLVGAQAPARRIADIEALGAKVIRTRQDRNGRLNLRHGLLELGRLGGRTLMVEGGSQILTSLLGDRLIDRMVVGIAPKIIGRGIPMIGDLNIARMGDAIDLVPKTVEFDGTDIIIDAKVKYKPRQRRSER